MRELSLNILDIAKNSVRAGASVIEIGIEEDRAACTLRITIKDNGCGMDAETAARVTEPFYTTRTTRKVGLGLPFFKMEAEMTGGTLSLQSRLGEGTSVSALFHTDHVDCLPLGDVGATMQTLIGGSPSIEFVLEHRLTEADGEKREMLFDTREIKAVLGEDIPLDTPEILAWISEYITEQYSGLYGSKT